MKKVCLKTGLSYVAKGFSCVKGSPAYVEDDMAAKLEKTDRFDVTDVDSMLPDPAAVGETIDIASMKKDDLIAFAKERSIDIEDCKNNEERIKRINQALDVAKFVQLGNED